MDLKRRGPKPDRYIVFVDLIKAFDSIDKNELLMILEKRIGNNGDLEMVKKLLVP